MDTTATSSSFGEDLAAQDDDDDNEDPGVPVGGSVHSIYVSNFMSYSVQGVTMYPGNNVITVMIFF